ncbi:hypothetical protein OSB04_un000774 [Centaurea solstitialis]|uniref:Retrotransposon gag domain-containing protein n=1 Tax=Centaurea solstitialis TaxID=347529 RepID=A0AA38SBY2_9ASTR|nr:hypothetical protein OSB04_un000774 [Centaurea solstitialis]
MDNTFVASLQQQLQQANEEIQRLRASHVPSMPIPSPYPPQHLRPPFCPQFYTSVPLSNNQQNYVRPSMPQGPPAFTFGPFNNTSQQIPIPGHIPTVASSTVHTTIPPNTGTSSGFIPTVPATTEDPLNVRLKSLEEQNQKLFALFAKLAGVAVPVEVEPKTGFQASPFVDEIAFVDVPKKYSIPAFATKYSEVTDPVEHVAQYKQLMWTVPIPTLYQVVCMCKSFGSTLTGATLQWLINLKPKSIGSFAELVNQFTRQFASSRKMEKQTSDLYYVVQKPGETIRDYFNRFNATMIEVKNCDVKTAIKAYKRGLEDSSGLYLELTKYPPENFDDVRARTLAFMRIEDDALFRRKHSSEKKPLSAHKHDFKHKRVNQIRNPRHESKTRPNKGTVKIRYPKLSTYNFAGTSKDLVDSLRKIDANLRWPKKSDNPSKDKDQNKWCDFHEDHGHMTDECISLKKEISYLKSKGHLKGVIPDEQGRPASLAHTKVINCITGGSEGVHHKHHDALVIQLTIRNCSTKRILIDGGSSANVIFADTLKVMGIERSEIVRRSTTLIGFNGDSMNTLGQITLPVFAKGINKQTKFNVIDCQSAYNVILGRPWIHEMKAVPSTIGIGFGIAILPGTFRHLAWTPILQSYFLIDKWYDFGPVMIKDVLRLKDERAALTKLDKELVENLKSQVLGIQANYLGKETPDQPERKVKLWGIHRIERLLYAIEWEDGEILKRSVLYKLLEECTRENLKDMYEIGMKLYKSEFESDNLQDDLIVKFKSVLECLCWLFEPSRIANLTNQPCEAVNEWRWFEKSEMYSLTINGMDKEYYFEESAPVHDLQ